MKSGQEFAQDDLAMTIAKTRIRNIQDCIGAATEYI